MLRKRESLLGDVLRAVLRQDGLETPLNEHRACEAWYEIMGPAITRYTKDVNVHGGTMYVEVTNAALRQELMMSRPVLVARINQHIGSQTVQQIVVR